mmetsp:Transcript_17671/g.35532  ORF Transcript_17671/g.35532 Transcript_17671/m.35532 type:complete len:117 (+) Transcript_17671:5-355(+)|eukprot:scaffold14974_cov195-Amphora_coffeaeformis.AAC.8
MSWVLMDSSQLDWIPGDDVGADSPAYARQLRNEIIQTAEKRGTTKRRIVVAVPSFGILPGKVSMFCLEFQIIPPNLIQPDPHLTMKIFFECILRWGRSFFWWVQHDCSAPNVFVKG